MTNSKSTKKTKKFNVFLIVAFIIMAIYSISVIAMILWGLLTSLKSGIDFTDLGNVIGLPDAKYSSQQMRFRNYKVVFDGFVTIIQDNSYISAIFGKISYPRTLVDFGDLLVNTLLYSVVGSVVHTLTVLIVAYICAKYKYWYTKLIYYVCLVIMMIPIVGSYPAEINMMQNLGLYNNYVGMFVQKINFTGIYFFVFYAYYETMSNTYIEAAEIDGASQLRVFVNVMLPLASKIFVTVFLITFIEYYNNYQTALLYFPSKPTLAYGVYMMSTQTFNQVSKYDKTELQSAPVRIAGCMVLAMPILILFIALKDVVMGNVSLGGIKE